MMWQEVVEQNHLGTKAVFLRGMGREVLYAEVDARSSQWRFTRSSKEPHEE